MAKPKTTSNDDAVFLNLAPPSHLIQATPGSAWQLQRSPSGRHSGSSGSSGSSASSSGQGRFPESASGSSGSGSERGQQVSRRGTEGYDYEFRPRVEAKFECPICMMVLRNPVQTPCGHRYCKACIQHWFKERHHPPCPVCNKRLHEVFPDNFAKREIYNLTVQCPNHTRGCEDIVTLKEIENHVNAVCPWGEVACPLKCSARVLRRDLEDHMTCSCTERTVACRYCGLHIVCTTCETHLLLCPEMEAECPFCQQVLLRKEMDTHKLACPLVRVACAFQPYGCEFQGTRAEMADHDSGSTVQHLRLVAEQLLRRGSSASMTPQHGMSTIPSLNTQPHTWPMMLPTPEGGPSAGLDLGFCSGVSSTVTSISTAPLPASSCSASQSYEESLNRALRDSSLDATRDESSGRDHGWTEPLTKHELRATETKPGTSVGSVEHLHEKVSDLQKQLRKCESRILHYEKTITEQSSRSYNGVYIWKVTDFQRRRRDAVSTKATVTNSPGFYSSSFGYKICMRINLNGVETGVGKYVSLFIHFMQGEYDDLLEWPFLGRITLSILDRRDCTAERQNISEHLLGKADLAAFQRPHGNRNNKGYGYIEFAPIEVIQSEGSYVKDDTLFIKAVIQEKA